MELYRYEPQPITLSISVNSALTDPDQLPVATIKSAQSNEPPREMVVTKVSVGLYRAEVLYSDVLYDKRFDVTWSYELDGAPVIKKTFHEVSTPYNSVEFLASTVSPDEATVEEIRLASRYAKSIIDSVCGRSFGQRYIKMNVYGENKETIVVNEPIVTILQISTGGDVIYDSESNSNQIDVSITPTGQGITISGDGDLISPDPAQRFNRGTIYQIGGIFGWDYVPIEVEQAHALLVNDWFCNDSKWKKNYVESVKAADWNLKYDSRVYTETGNFYADTLLLDYHHRAMVIP